MFAATKHGFNRTRRSALLIALLLALGTAATAQEPSASRYVAQPAQEFTLADNPAMLLPTDVAIDQAGNVYVLDAQDRVLVFDATGQLHRTLTHAGDTPLSRPLGLTLDRDGNLWIADTGNTRVVVLTPDGQQLREIRPPTEPGGRSADITDVAVSPDGQIAWLVDNDGHAVYRYEIETGVFSRFGTVGQSLGEFHYPFAAATNDRGDIFITEALNGRVQILDTHGRVVGSLATYGADYGNLYRPKGLALDRDGNVWVVDGTMGVVQIFRPNGVLIDVLRNPQGEPLKLDTPCGITLDDAGNVYVTLLQPNRVQKLTVATNTDVPGLNLAARARGAATVQPRACAACHTEWLQPLASGGSTPLLSPPESSPDYPAVTRPRSCLSCHDGSIVDSRKRVWHDHGHRLGTGIPSSIQVPSELPLVEGAMVCRTCHSAHTRGGSGNVLRDAVFLRTDGKPSDLCMSCHTQFAGGQGHGMHPLGQMDIALPAALHRGGITPSGNEVTCTACHNGHGSQYTNLLALGTEDNQLCLSCHTALSPALFGEEKRSAHGRLPHMLDDQLQFASDLDTPVGTDDALLCVTCHITHSAPISKQLLAFDPATDAACAGCHTRSAFGQQYGPRLAHESSRRCERRRRNARTIRGMQRVPHGAPRRPRYESD